MLLTHKTECGRERSWSSPMESMIFFQISQDMESAGHGECKYHPVCFSFEFLISMAHNTRLNADSTVSSVTALKNEAAKAPECSPLGIWPTPWRRCTLHAWPSGFPLPSPSIRTACKKSPRHSRKPARIQGLRSTVDSSHGWPRDRAHQMWTLNSRTVPAERRDSW